MKTRAKYKKCRRLGSAIYEKCRSAKFSISEEKKNAANKSKRRPRISEYGQKLIEKQKLRLSYGLKEKKLKSYVFGAIDSSEETFLKIYSNLETRLDNVVYRFGLASTRAAARQMVSHGHIMVNGRKLNIPSYPVKIGDKISVREESKDRATFTSLVEKDLAQIPVWLDFDYKKLEGEVKSSPVLDTKEFDFQQIIEFYTR